MTLPAGTKLGPYEVVAPLGAGGMGEVVRARDTRLQREVAIKALPEAFARDPERLARFEREARMLAALSHPNVGAIYGLEEADGHRYLVLEFVDGETLARRLARGPLPLDDALEVCRQIAAALEAAHESGIIHRDLKSGNVMLTPSGAVKVLDFGLAKGGAGTESSSDPSLSASPTMTYAATGAGVILGTAAYMSPEQARGKAVDKRTDIWSFGCVLYECLTGRQVFEGETISDLIARILEREPDLGALPAPTPNRLRELLRRCLEKDARRRLRDIGDAKIELEDVLAVRSSGSVRAAAGAAASRPRSLAGLLAFGAAVALVTAAVTLLAPRVLHRAPPLHPARFAVVAPEGVTFPPDGSVSAISPDGRMLAYVAVDSTGTANVYVRPLESLTARALPGTDNADLPFWSPDSRFIGFFADGKLKKVPVQGGAVEVLCNANNGRGGTWNASGTILFCPAGEGPIFRVPAGGGDPQRVTTLDSTRHETGHRFPCFLPDGRHFLFSVLPARQGMFDVDLASLDSPKRTRLLSSTGGAVYAPPGYLLYVKTEALVAQRFDAGRLRLVGDPVSIGDVPAGSNYSGARLATASNNGTLLFFNGRVMNTTLVWASRAGKRLDPIRVPTGRYETAALSPDNRRAVVTRLSTPSESDLWIVELERGVTTRFTFGPSQSGNALWSPDGSQIAFETDRDGPWNLYVKPVSGATPEEPLVKSSALFKHLTSWSRDGRFIVFEQLDAKTGWDLWLIPMQGDRTPRPYLRTPYNERFGDVSPDGRWVVYSSDESGRSEVYAQSFPTPGNKYQVSTGGGFGGTWRQDGKEIVFGGPDRQTAIGVDIPAGPEFHPGVPHAILKLPPDLVFLTPAHDFQRLLLIVPAGGTAAASLKVVLDWPGALGRP